MDLFLDKVEEDGFFKMAAFAARVSETQENWPQELTSEIMRQLPYMSDYEVNVNLQSTDPQRGYGFGYADVTARTERPEAEHGNMGIPHIRIPIVIKDRAVKPFNVFLDGERVVPLTEERVRQTLFNPQAFDLSSSAPRDPSLVEAMMPPTRTGPGMGGEYKVASVQKTATMAGYAQAVRKNPNLLVNTMNKARIMPDGRFMHDLGKADPTLASAATLMMKGRSARPITRESLGGYPYKVASVQKSAGIGDFFETLKHNPNSAELDRVFKSYKKRTGKDPSSMSQAEINTYLKDLRSSASKKKQSSIQKLAELEPGTAYYHNPTTNKFHKVTGAQSWDDLPDMAREQIIRGNGVYKAHPKPPMSTGTKAALGLGVAALLGYGAYKLKKHFDKSKQSSVLHAIAPTIRASDASSFIQKVASDPNLIAGFRRSGVAGSLVEVFDNVQDNTSEDLLSKVASSVVPTVTTFFKLPGGDFLVKMAATDAFAGGPQAAGVVMPQQQVAQAIGPENAQAMLPGQSATAVANPVPEVQSTSPSPLPPETDDEVADQFGQWMVQDLMGNRLSGWVFPNTLAWDGNFTPQPMALFSNGSSYAFQDSIAGELVGKSTILPSDVPRGDGCFYLIKGGKAIATQPVTIASSMSGPDGLPKFTGTDAFGKTLQVSFMPGIKEPTRLSDIEFAFPDNWKFMRLNNQTQLVSDPVQMNKSASVRNELNSVELLYNGAYHLRGQCGLDKVAYSLKNDLDSVGAEFMLGVLGVDGITSKTKIAEARRRGVVKLSGLHTITTFEERMSSNVKTASAILAQVPDLKCDLIKEAASLDDESTINNVLALNFINPENLHTFINYIPDLEMTSERLAEMWLYSVMGMNELPEEHIERAMKNMENVIEGLKALAHAEI